MAKDHKISQDFFVVSFLSFLSFQSLRLNRKGIPTVAFWGLPLQPHREFVETRERRNVLLCSIVLRSFFVVRIVFYCVLFSCAESNSGGVLCYREATSRHSQCPTIPIWYELDFFKMSLIVT